jgi:hypothetical protein
MIGIGMKKIKTYKNIMKINRRYKEDEDGNPVAFNVDINDPMFLIGEVMSRRYGDLHDIWKELNKVGVFHTGYDLDSVAFGGDQVHTKRILP